MIAARIDIEQPGRIFGITFPWTATKRARIPQEWSEMRTRHYAAMLRLILTASHAHTDEELISASAHLFCDWAGIPLAYADSEKLASIDLHAHISGKLLQSIKQPKPFWRHFLHLRSPGHRLKRLCFRQYVTAERMRKRWIETGDEEMITAICALTWRPPLMPWRPWMSTLAMHWLALTPFAVRARMACTYISQRMYLRQMYKELHTATTEAKEPKIDQIILAMSGTELGSYEQVAYQPVHRVLALMQMREQQFQKQRGKHGTSNLTVEELHEAARDLARRSGRRGAA